MKSKTPPPVSPSPLTVAVDIGNSFLHFGFTGRDGFHTCQLPNQWPKKRTTASTLPGDEPVVDPAFGNTIGDAIGKDVGNMFADAMQQTIDQILVITGQEPSTRMGWRVAAVDSQAAEQLRNWIGRFRNQDSFYRVSHDDIPIGDTLTARKSTGIDRLLAAWFAFTTGKVGCDTVMVDAGSAVTIDWVSPVVGTRPPDTPAVATRARKKKSDAMAVGVVRGLFRGGMIFPGERLCASSLALGTDALPHVTLQHPESIIQQVIGQSTIPAISAGIFWQQWGGILQGVQQLQSLAGGSVEVVVSGGGMRHLTSLLPDHWRHEPDIVLRAILDLQNLTAHPSF